jgi:hypothetical protein
MRFISILFLFCANLFTQNLNQNLDYYFSELNFIADENIPTPHEILGFNVGEWHVSHDKLLSYMLELEKASDRVKLEKTGKTYEGRDLVVLIITSEKNHNNIDNIIKQRSKVYENEKDLKNKKIVVYQGFSIHGNESSGSNASLLYAYYLASAKGDFINNILENSVIIIDPSMNPDGLQRFSGWVNSHRNMNLTSDSNDREYNEVWPGGRTNHYWFDLNRDWLPAQLPESQSRLKTFYKWMPNILTDHHEMGTNATYFFQPGVPSRTHPLTPEMNQILTKKISKYFAEDLDNIGSLYFSGERFDDFYYGKGSTFPDINGSIGILFEQASSRGHFQESENGILTFAYTIKNQLTTSISTIKAALDLKDEIIKYQNNFYDSSQKKNNHNDEYLIFGNEKDKYRTKKLAEILLRHQIDIYESEVDILDKDKIYKSGYSYLVPKNQKQINLINAMFESRTKFNDSIFYDVSAWTLPHAFNLDYNLNFIYKKELKKINEIDFSVDFNLEPSNYAYLIEWHEYLTPKALNMLLEKNIRVKVATQQFNVKGVKYDYGTLMIPVLGNDAENLHKNMIKISDECKLTVNTVNTGLTLGPDLGSNSFKTINKKNIAILIGDGISAYDAGEIWHLLDTRYDIAISKIQLSTILKSNLNKYTTLIIPSSEIISNEIIKKITDWTKNGGTLITYKNSIDWLQSANIIDFNIIEQEISANDISYEDADNFYDAQKIGGAIFQTQLDLTHPINFGFTNEYMPIFRNSTIFLKPDNNKYKTPIKYTENPLLSGYISQNNLETLKNTTPIKITGFGDGNIIYLTDNTNFRAFWYGTNKVLMNAIFFADIIETNIN